MDIICCVARQTRKNRIRGSLGGPLLQPDRRLGSSAYPQVLSESDSSRTCAGVQTHPLQYEEPPDIDFGSDNDNGTSSSDDEDPLDSTPLDRFTREFKRLGSALTVSLGEPAPSASSARSSLRTSFPEQPKKLFTVYFADAEGSTTDNEDSSDSDEKAAEDDDADTSDRIAKDLQIPVSSMGSQGTPSFLGPEGTPTFLGSSDSPTFLGAPTFSGTPTFC